ncbi:hypothetical protein CK203_112381 [Vitis vinifera]|uniref:Uncharacterized protein n=1 Tax=Vitis vinifera TaxID=29760 RepID=A0A438C8S2_VITVI|nr:hypothetical protein CK203_112381 [Vitis vinifera]
METSSLGAIYKILIENPMVKLTLATMHYLGPFLRSLENLKELLMFTGVSLKFDVEVIMVPVLLP